ncbi:HAD-IC family P-type ATPase [Liquorilactobacillus cacaonum]|uniref:Cation transport ATPase n=1 Tax=Liquorilactobacillus cacaonum DSM 21116 TaxID=1423729 RepID=A0A0R2CEG9_9LACO|nr:HAD-IC family P-type ATPase [Liquorilactobacillus cacaonum]KRM89911.1 cation transport ATPase [Liquorilactobacillus cacaonum DSM 21116]
MQDERQAQVVEQGEDSGDEGAPSHKQNWQLSAKQLENHYQTNAVNGLNTDEAQLRLSAYGKNELEVKKKSNWILFLRQFNNSIVYILAITAIVTLLMKHYPDSIVIGAVIIANAFVGFFQEVSADNALNKIQELLVAKSVVIRDGKRRTIDAKDIVVGDIISLEAGDSVPADIRLLTADNLKIQESTLTGETNSVSKIEEKIDKESVPLAERANMAFAATTVTSGSGTGIVIATGMKSQIGKIQTDVIKTKDKVTPLMQNLNKLGITLSLTIVAIAVALFFLGMHLEIYSLPTLTVAIITLIVGSMPEGMPASVSVVLAMGTRKLTKKNAIVKTLPAVETLGAVDIVNTDKTGTLTKNEMIVTDIITAEEKYKVLGVGYDTRGEIVSDSGKIVEWDSNNMLQQLINIAGQTTDASFHFENDAWLLTGEPTDGALASLYHKVTGEDPVVSEIDSLPFDSEFRYSARLVENDGKRYLMVKGAPQTLLKKIKKFNPKFKEEQIWLNKVTKLSKQGKRVVGLGLQQVDINEVCVNSSKIGDDFIFAGIVGIIDPPREEVKEAIKQLRYAGVKVKMITGDDPNTALAIANQLDMGDNLKAITGPELDKMSDKELIDNIDKYTVFARTTPSDKLKIVKAQQRRNHVVSMTGDGVNDAPALKQADIGVAMGIKGTDVAKGSADMVLADDNFTTILSAVKEGRLVFDNIRKTIRFLLPTSFAEGLIVVFSILLDQTMPLYPTQLLWINMVSALTIQFAFIFEPAESGIMYRGPRNISKGILTKMNIIEITYVAILIASLGMVAYNIMTGLGMSHTMGSTMTLNIIVFGKIFYLFNIRNNHLVLSKYFFQNKKVFYIVGILVLLQVGIIYLPFMQEIFHTGSIDLFYGWILPSIAGLLVLMVTEVIKVIRLIYTKKQVNKKIAS